MRRDPITGITVLDDTLVFRDASESQVLEVLEQATDRTSMSDELAQHIVDWPTRYHFSRSRRRLLDPIMVDEGTRVLDIGAGTGVIARALGERGAQVVALEGDLARARAAATRCAGLDQVEIVCGTLASYHSDQQFDLVCVIGVLEYSQIYSTGAESALATLELAASRLAPDGALVLAIENQLGLKYLLGYPEDHLGEPFAGIEGYLGGRRVQTWSRRKLAELLTKSGLAQQIWLYPYPDYKLPGVILADAAFDQPDAVTLIDAVVRKPSSEAGHARPTACHEREAHRVFLEAGLGREVANSFLVVAGRTAHPTVVPESTLTWHFGSERLRSWMRVRTTEVAPQGRRVLTAAVDATPGLRQRGWLRQHDEAEVVFQPGPTVEQLALAACRDHDLDRLREVLGDWAVFLEQHGRPRSSGGRKRHPFLPSHSTFVLPQDMLDVSLSNIIAGPDGFVLVDREWQVAGGVDRDLAALRALWYFAADVVSEQAPHPLHPDSSVDELALAFAELAGLEAGLDDLVAVREAEHKLQAVVTGRRPEEIATELAWLGRRGPLDGDLVRAMPFTRLQRELSRLTEATRDGSAASAAELADTAAALRRAERAVEDYEQGNAQLERTIREQRETISELQKEVSAGLSKVAALEQQDGHLRGVTETLRSQLDAALREMRDTHSRMEDLSAHRSTLEGEAQRMRAERDAAMVDASRTQARLQAISEQHVTLEGEVERLRQDLADARARADREASDRTEALRSVTALEKDLEQRCVEVSELGEHNDELLAEVAALGEHNDELHAEVAALGERNDELHAEVAALGERNDELMVAAAAERAATERATVSLTQREVDWRIAAKRNIELRATIDDLRAQLDGLARERDALNGEVGHWRQWHAAFDQRLPIRMYRAVRRLAGGSDR